LGVVLALAGAKLACSARVLQTSHDDFHEAVARAAKLSTLAEPGAPPFHLKLAAQDTSRMHDPEFTAEIEIWWVAPDKWRRAVKSPDFTQTAIQNGPRYYESNTSSDYLPYWLDQLIQGSTNPVPIEALADVSVDDDQSWCGRWEIPHGSGDQKFSSYAQVCFNPDGTVQRIYAGPIGLELGDYQRFGDHLIARQLKVWPRGGSEVTATVTLLEPLEKQEPPGATLTNIFEPPQDTGLASRVRFVSAPESALEQADSSTRPPLTWPSSYIFPVDGSIAVTIHIDRDGNIREFPSTISKNQAINGGAVAQIKNWKFKPYIVDGAPVQVVTTLEVPFHLKYEPLGANGKEFPPISFGEHMRQCRALSDLRADGSKPFHLRTSFILARGGTGKYEEVWQSSTEWTRQVEIGGAVLRERLSREKFTTESDGDTTRQIEMKAVMTAMQDRFPDSRTFQEADWGNSAVSASNVYPQQDPDSSEPVLIRAARGAVNANNHPTSGQAYWFDSDGLLRASFADNVTAVNSNFVPWNLKQVPRRVEVFFGPMPVAVVTVDSIEAPQIQDRIAIQNSETSAGMAR
jgi:hypothetical protein